MRTLAIGDIHGMSTCLDALLAAVQPTAEDQVVFLGDYVDRGPDTRGVLDRLIQLQQRWPRTVFLQGNHEIMMREARTGGGDFRNWLSVGGRQALESYGLRIGAANVLDQLPGEHWNFLDARLTRYLETSTHIFVHANAEPGLPLADTGEFMLCWEFLTGPVRHFSGKIVICGHTSQKSGVPLDLGDTICIDTYAHGGGWLTALDVHSLEYWQADVLGRVRSGQLPPRTASA